MIYLYKTSQKEIKVNYEIIGEGQPLVMIHGLVCDMRLMKGCMEPIFKSMGSKGEKYKRIYIDLPGMGKSESVEEIASSDKILEVLTSFIKDTIDENFLLVGESYGGYLARGILCEMMDKTNGLALICPVIFPENEDRILPERSII
ncbi:MAG: alpha/beta hydrolase, partial [Leptotrichiaceae bacterium]|nr:alpha/beta hydrolase [Leptotrichiaceae bacterium]